MDVFLTAMTDALEHQYNTHWDCGDWCTYIDLPELNGLLKMKQKIIVFEKKDLILIFTTKQDQFIFYF